MLTLLAVVAGFVLVWAVAFTAQPYRGTPGGWDNLLLGISVVVAVVAVIAYAL